MHRSARAIAIAATAALVTSGCGGSAGDDPPQSSRSRTTDAQSADEVTERDVEAGGHTLYLRCWGAEVPGEPTVLLLAGSGPPASIWETMAPDLAADGHHLCL